MSDDKPTIPDATKDAQARASNPHLSSWAGANAGAGKTYVLTARVARLLLDGQHPDRILCITYTKAAAAEMKARLFKRLGGWSTLEDAALRAELATVGVTGVADQALPRARQLFARALETPGGLKIQTIHSFCQLVLSRFPLEAGVPPAFSVLDDRQSADLLETARDWLLCDGDVAGALATVITRTEETGFAALLGEIRTHRSTFAPLTAPGGLDDATAHLAKTLQIPDGATDASLLADALSPQAFEGVPLAAMTRVLSGGSKTDQERAQAIQAFLEADDPVTAYPDYAKIYLTETGAPRKRLITKKPAEDHPAIAAALDTEQDRIVALETTRRAARMAEATGALLQVAACYLGHYDTLKAAQGALDYEDLIQRTLGLMADGDASAWVLYKLDQGIDHILIDEAQDTSPNQWDIIRHLAEEFFSDESRSRTIFAVGDEKQSIYSFQGADPSAFGCMRALFATRTTQAQRRWDPVELSLSFRSTPEILRAVDLVFADDISRRMVTVGGNPVHHTALRSHERGLLVLGPSLAADVMPVGEPWYAPLERVGAASPAARLARQIADTIIGWQRTGERVPSTGAMIRPRDILILVRRRNAFVDMLVRTFKEAGVPVAGADRLMLTEHIAVMDLIALGQCALLPDDDLTLATVLKGPFFDWSEDQLFELAYERACTRLWQALQAGDAPHHKDARDRLHRIRTMALTRPPFDFYAWLLSEGGGRRALLRRLGPDAGDPVEEFLSLTLEAERHGATALQEVLHELTAMPRQIKRDMEAAGADEVRIMTVHGAKGLEAPIVFLPDTCSQPDGKQDPAILIDPETGGAPLALWPGRKAEDTPVSATLRAALAERREAEYRRLLYVAMTRAQDRLYLCGYEGRHPRKETCWYSLAETALMPEMHAVKTAWGTAHRLGTPETPATDLPPAAAPAAPPPLPKWATARPPAERVPPRAIAPSQLIEDGVAGTPVPALSPLLRGQAFPFGRGRIIHKLLEALPELPQAERVAAATRYLALPAHGLAEEAAEALLREVLAIMDAPDFAPLFGPDSQAEVPLTGTLPALGDGIVIDGRVDRMVVTPTSIALIDYKTNRPAPTQVDRVPAAYVAQMALYRALLRHLFPGRAVTCALLWTDRPHALSLPDAALDEAIIGLTRRMGAAGPRLDGPQAAS